jgi:CRISPR-associated endonuclease/helicase Cas3
MDRAHAHRDGACGSSHDLVEHLADVATLAARNAVRARAGDAQFARLASAAGWLHDLGKYRREFQEYLYGMRDGGRETQHAVFGAAGCLHRKVPLSAVLAILGHHAGLHDFTDAKGSLKDSDLNPLEASKALLARLEREWPGGNLPWAGPIREAVKPGRNGPSIDHADELRARMLFSCLVDADWLDTEAYYTGRCRVPARLRAGALFERLQAYVRALSEGSDPTPVNECRRGVYDACIRAASEPPGCFGLTAPTGSGKTLASMAFALRHAEAHGLRRVIVVLPFLAIIEQNARVYREALNLAGEPDVVLEHHSAFDASAGDDSDASRSENESAARLRAKQATENWDAPVLVTTAVQFLESLFARRPRQCRKLHNIARSVVVFDEVQTLPFPLLDPILSVVRDLRDHFGVSFLFGSATRPNFERSPNLPGGFEPGECREVLEEPKRTFEALRRVRPELPCLREKWSWDVLAAHLRRLDEPRALVIVNLRKHAQDLYDRLRRENPRGLFHLSSTMCAAHRESILGRKGDPGAGTIYHALASGDRCIVVSTQVVEAGVDLDFPVVFRALAPLDAIIQAAGRADRDGNLTRAAGTVGGRVIVFDPAAEPSTPRGFYSEATAVARAWLGSLAAEPGRVLDDPEVFAEFHAHLIAHGMGRETGRTIQDERRRLNFRKVADLFRIIDDAGQGVVVPFGDAGEILHGVRARGFPTIEDRRRLQRYTVNLFPQWVALLALSLHPVSGADEGLLACDPSIYDEAVGLRLGELPPEFFCV